MGAIGLTIKLEKINSEKKRAVEEAYAEIRYWINKNINHYATNKTWKKEIICNYLSEIDDDAAIDEVNKTIDLFFPDSAGMTDVSMAVSHHWVEIGLVQLYDQLNTILTEYGFRIKPPVYKLEDIIHQKAAHPFFEIQDRIYGIYRTDKTEILSDYGPLSVDELTPQQKKKIRTISESFMCQCPLCTKIRKEKLPVNINEISQKEPQGFEFDKLSTALRYPHRVKKLFLSFKPSSELPDTIKNLSNLEELMVCDTGLEKISPEIKNCKKLKKLDVHWNYLESVPKAICELGELRELNVSDNRIKNLPEEIGHLSKLEIIRGGQKAGGKIETLPPSFANLKELLEIEFIGADFEHIPNEILSLIKLKSINLMNSKSLGNTAASFPFDRLQSLESINLRYTGLTAFPSALLNLANIMNVDVSRNQIKELPEFLTWQKIKSLRLEDNRIEVIPESVYNLTTLEDLHIDNNPVIYLSDKIGHLVNLTYLGLSGLKIDKLPESIGNLVKLECLYIRDIELKELPQSLTNCKNLQNIFCSDQDRIKKMADEIGLENVEIF